MNSLSFAGPAQSFPFHNKSITNLTKSTETLFGDTQNNKIKKYTTLAEIKSPNPKKNGGLGLKKKVNSLTLPFWSN